jgi:hypothetical protein
VKEIDCRIDSKSANCVLTAATADAAGEWYHSIKYDQMIASVCCWEIAVLYGGIVPVDGILCNFTHVIFLI